MVGAIDHLRKSKANTRSWQGAASKRSEVSRWFCETTKHSSYRETRVLAGYLSLMQLRHSQTLVTTSRGYPAHPFLFVREPLPFSNDLLNFSHCDRDLFILAALDFREHNTSWLTTKMPPKFTSQRAYTTMLRSLNRLTMVRFQPQQSQSPLLTWRMNSPEA